MMTGKIEKDNGKQVPIMVPPEKHYAHEIGSWGEAIEEERTILRLAMPIVASQFLNFLLNIVDLAMVGRFPPFLQIVVLAMISGLR